MKRFVIPIMAGILLTDPIGKRESWSSFLQFMLGPYGSRLGFLDNGNTQMQHAAILAISFMFLVGTPSSSAQSSPRFEDYEVAVYSGIILRPKWIRQVRGDEWRDDLGKLVEPPEVNFAGKYFVAVHSCGTGCRYYTMTDLSSGRELDVLKDFGAMKPPSKTRQGHPYITDLITRANSKLLVAQYHVEVRGSEECRERAFVLVSDKVTPITSTRFTCSQY